MATYNIHGVKKNADGKTFYGIKLDTGTNNITVSNTESIVSVNIPETTVMKCVDTDNFFNFNYCAFIAFKFYTSNDGTGACGQQFPAQEDIDNFSSQSWYGNEWSRGNVELEKLDQYIFLFKAGIDSSKTSLQGAKDRNWTSKINRAATITCKIPSWANSYSVHVCGCSAHSGIVRAAGRFTSNKKYTYITDPNTATTWPLHGSYAEYATQAEIDAVATYAYPKWWFDFDSYKLDNPTRGRHLSGGNACTCTGHIETTAVEKPIITEPVIKWEPNTAKLTLVDNGNNTATAEATIYVGDNNDITSSSLSVIAPEKAFEKYIDVALDNSTGKLHLTYTYLLKDNLDIDSLSLSVQLKGTSYYGDNIDITRDCTVLYYKAPQPLPANSVWWEFIPMDFDAPDTSAWKWAEGTHGDIKKIPNRVTLRDRVRLGWYAGSGANNSSPIAGYHICLTAKTNKKNNSGYYANLRYNQDPSKTNIFKVTKNDFTITDRKKGNYNSWSDSSNYSTESNYTNIIYEDKSFGCDKRLTNIGKTKSAFAYEFGNENGDTPTMVRDLDFVYRFVNSPHENEATIKFHGTEKAEIKGHDHFIGWIRPYALNGKGEELYILGSKHNNANSWGGWTFAELEVVNSGIFRVNTSDDPTNPDWREGTVFVHNGTTWKEAENIYVNTDSKTTWKESI